jgi:hypothetical protein
MGAAVLGVCELVTGAVEVKGFFCYRCSWEESLRFTAEAGSASSALGLGSSGKLSREYGLLSLNGRRRGRAAC